MVVHKNTTFRSDLNKQDGRHRRIILIGRIQI